MTQLGKIIMDYEYKIRQLREKYKIMLIKYKKEKNKFKNYYLNQLENNEIINNYGKENNIINFDIINNNDINELNNLDINQLNSINNEIDKKIIEEAINIESLKDNEKVDMINKNESNKSNENINNINNNNDL